LPRLGHRPDRKQKLPEDSQPKGQVPFGGFGIASWAPDVGVQNEPLLTYPCAHEPPGPGGFGCGNGAAAAAVIATARMKAFMP
jgi:hypothetical protein